MSWALIRAVKASDLTFTESSLLIFLASYADRETKRIHPKNSTVAAETGLSVSAVSNTIQSLVAKRCLVQVAALQNNVKVYEIDMEALSSRPRRARSERRPRSVPYESGEEASGYRANDEPVTAQVGDRNATSPLDDEPVHHDRGSTSSSEAEPLIRKEPLVEPLSSTTSNKLGGIELGDDVDEEWDHASHPDADVVRFATAVAASKRWGRKRVPDRQACENLLAMARRTIRESGKAPGGLGPALGAFEALVLEQRPKHGDNGPGLTLQEVVRYRLKDMPEAPPEPEPAPPPPRIAEPPPKRLMGWIVGSHGRPIQVHEGYDLKGRRLHATRREAEAELLDAQGAGDVTAPRLTEAQTKDRADRGLAELRRLAGKVA